MRRLLHLLAWSLLCMLLISNLSLHAVDLGMSPLDADLQLNRGSEYKGELFLFGSDEETTDIKAALLDWSLTVKGAYQFLPAGTLPNSASPWISFSPLDFSLPPKRGQKINYTVKVPPDAAFGSYWCTIVFETKPTLLPKGQFQVTAAGRLAYIIKITINGSSPGIGTIERFNLSWNEKDRMVDATLRVKNSGSSFIKFKGRLEIKDHKGNGICVMPFREGSVLPGYSREFVLTPSEGKTPELQPGYYVALAVVDFGDRKLKAVQESFEVKE